MSEGTARELVAKAIFDYRARNWPSDKRWDEAGWLREEDREGYREWADAVLAALQQAGALAPAGLTAADLDAAQRDVAEALRMATQAGIGFEQGMPNARRLASDADRKATEAFRALRALAAPAADAAPGEPS